MIHVECRTNAEYEACIKAGNIAVVFGLHVEAWGNSSVVAWGNSSVVARENSSVEAWGNSSVVARENVLVRLFSALKVEASAYVGIYMHGKAKHLTGGRRLKCAPFPKTIKQWADLHGVKVENGYAFVYKGTDDDYSTEHARSAGIYYKVGEKLTSLDWDGGKKECGNGLHFSPRPVMALEFNIRAKRFLLCKVKLSECRKPRSDDIYPHKIKAKGCEVVAEVDRPGKPIA